MRHRSEQADPLRCRRKLERERTGLAEAVAPVGENACFVEAAGVEHFGDELDLGPSRRCVEVERDRIPGDRLIETDQQRAAEREALAGRAITLDGGLDRAVGLGRSPRSSAWIGGRGLGDRRPVHVFGDRREERNRQTGVVGARLIEHAEIVGGQHDLRAHELARAIADLELHHIGRADRADVALDLLLALAPG